MRKGIATQTILLFLVGIVVVSVLIYIVYRTVMNPSLSSEECRGRLIGWCTVCKNTNFENADPIPIQILNDCKDALAKIGVYIATESGGQKKCTEMKTDCRRVGVE